MQQSWKPPDPSAGPTKRRFWLKWQDAFAIAIVGFVAWKLLIAPRIFSERPYPAPAVLGHLAEGGQFSLAAQRDHVVFLDFWASWCEPCKISLPLVERYARAHPGSRVYTVNVADPPNVARKFARDHGLSRVILDTDDTIAPQFGVTGFPTMVVVDAKGFVRAKWIGLNPAIAAAMSNADRTLR